MTNSQVSTRAVQTKTSLAEIKHLIKNEILRAFISAFLRLPMHKQNCLYASKEGFCHLKVCFLSALCHLFYSHPQKVQSRFRAPSCWMLFKQRQAEIPDLAETHGKSLPKFRVLCWVLPRAS